jgi:N-sulfoglucosamine sulfohydrolase
VDRYLHRPAEELYDVTEDPLEVHNLAGSSAHAALLRELRSQVKEFRVQTKDPWLVNDEYR